MYKIIYGLCFLISSWSTHAYHDAGPGKNSLCIYHDTKYTCDCANTDEIVELPTLTGHVFHISISNCKNLMIVTNFLTNTHGLRSVNFMNVENLVLQQNALAFPQLLSSTRLIIEFNNVTIKEIQSHVFNGNIDEITFTSSKIDHIRPFSFTSFKDKAYFIKFISTVFNMVEPQAFKKFSVDQLEFNNCVFLMDLPSRTFYDVDVKDFFKVYNTTFKTALSRAFSFSHVAMLTIIGNQFEKSDGECFDITIGDSIMIKNNTFGETHPYAFRAFDISKEYSARRSEKMEFRFFDNRVQQAGGPAPFEFNDNFQLAPKNLFYLNDFDCTQIDKLKKSKFFKTYGDFIFIKLRESDKYLSITQILKDCKKSSNWIYFGAGLGALLFLGIIAAAIAYYFVRKRQKEQLDIVMPEPRTYRETQIVLQIENAGLLKTDM